MAKRKRSNPFLQKNKKGAMSEKDKERRNKIYMGVFISVIMVGSILGIFVSQNDGNLSLEYENSNGEAFNFQLGQNFYTTKINGEEMNFYYHPNDLQSMFNDTSKVEEVLQTGQAVLIFDTNDTNIVFIDLARFELSNQLSLNNQAIYSAKTDNSTNYPALPVLNCDNATSALPFIYFKSGAYKIELENNCLVMQGSQYDFLRFKDLITYTSYKVLP